VSRAPAPTTYIRKAETTLSGARILLSSGDADGACSRAYYAMFDAEHGGDLNKVQTLRELADYSGDPIGIDRAAWAVERAEAFVSAVKAAFGL